MVKEIRIEYFNLADYDDVRESEVRIARLVNDGWMIVAGGGSDRYGFVILQRDIDESAD